MTDRLDEIRSRAEAATPGPWTIEPLDRKYYGTEILDGNAELLFTIWRENESGPSVREIERSGLDGDFDWSHMELADDYADATFIAHAREDIPYLLAENEQLIAFLAAAYEECNRLMDLYIAQRREHNKAAAEVERLRAALEGKS